MRDKGITPRSGNCIATDYRRLESSNVGTSMHIFLFMLLPNKHSELAIAGDQKAVATVCGLTEYFFFYKSVEN